MTQQVLVENLQRAGKAGHLAGAGALGGIEAVVVERCPTDFDGPARIQAIAALSHGVFLLTACRFAGRVVLAFNRRGRRAATARFPTRRSGSSEEGRVGKAVGVK